MERIPRLPTGETFATMCALLETVPFTQQVIPISTPSRTMLKEAQSSLFRLGGRAHPDFSGIQPVCSDAVAQTCLTQKPDLAPGCDGSRTFSGIEENRMGIGVPRGDAAGELNAAGHHPGPRVSKN
jgi:uncharacterized protein (DUF169 family)